MNSALPDGGPTRSAPVKCLVVDDLEDNLFTLSALLRDEDVEVLTASSGRQALELLLVHDVALALLDVQMPEIDGFELAELMRSSERTRHVPLIFITAGAREPQRLFKGYDAGAVDFLFKPIEPWLLRSKARVFFELYRNRRELARELAERTQTLRMNEMFSAVLAHDLRSPLGAVLNAARAIELASGGNETTLRAARMVVSSTRSMERMVNDLLDLARARLGGGIPLRMAPADLAEVAATVLEEQRSSHPGRRFELRATGDCSGVWDGGRLAQLLANLVGNAVTHGERDAAVSVSIDGAGPGTVRVGVRSAGAISDELLPRLFDPFRSGPSPDSGRPGVGLGLGLYIVEQIAQAHGGRVQASSMDGWTLFEVELPREAARAPNPGTLRARA